MEYIHLSTESIRHNLKTKNIGQNIIVLDSVDSSNIYLKTLAIQDAPEGTVVISEEQTAGRGRLGRTWVSAKGHNLTFSVLLRPHAGVDKYGIISLVAGIAVTRAVRSCTSLPAECKWPNDVLIHGKKVCGILSETVTNLSPAVIVGIGINVNQSEFPEDIKQTATSLSLESNTGFDRVKILQGVLEELEYWYTQFQADRNDTIIQEWKKCCPMISQTITINQNGSILRGVFRDVTDDGALMLECNGAIKRIFAGDVTVVKPGNV